MRREWTRWAVWMFATVCAAAVVGVLFAGALGAGLADRPSSSVRVTLPTAIAPATGAPVSGPWRSWPGVAARDEATVGRYIAATSYLVRTRSIPRAQLTATVVRADLAARGVAVSSSTAAAIASEVLR